jgi:hypothetical protein
MGSRSRLEAMCSGGECLGTPIVAIVVAAVAVVAGDNDDADDNNEEDASLLSPEGTKSRGLGDKPVTATGPGLEPTVYGVCGGIDAVRGVGADICTRTSGVVVVAVVAVVDTVPSVVEVVVVAFESVAGDIRTGLDPVLGVNGGTGAGAGVSLRSSHSCARAMMARSERAAKMRLARISSPRIYNEGDCKDDISITAF